ncbi:MAG: hypothetical protein R3C68_06090 [Myxococcota bacterium]
MPSVMPLGAYVLFCKAAIKHSNKSLRLIPPSPSHKVAHICCFPEDALLFELNADLATNGFERPLEKLIRALDVSVPQPPLGSYFKKFVS